MDTRFTKGMTVAVLTHGVLARTATIDRLTQRHAVTLCGTRFGIEDGCTDDGRQRIRAATDEERAIARAMNEAFDLARTTADRAASALIVVAYYSTLPVHQSLVEERVRTYTAVAGAT